jgi:dipeptidyl-peptidase-3
VADLGTKNLSFENRINARDKRLPFSFLSRSDNALCSLLFGIAFGATVAFHELLGHGTGKLLSELSPGEFNFNLSGLPISPVSGERISTWYKPGEKWKPMFGNAYEECRCELVALHYLAQPEKLAILGIEMEPQDDRPLASDGMYFINLVIH